MKKYLLIAACLLGMTSAMSSVQAQEKTTPRLATDETRCAAWVDSVMSRLSLQEKVGQLLVPRVPAVADKATRKRLKEWVRKYKIGGLLFGKGTIGGQAALTNQAQKDAKVPLLMTVDGEWGLAMRLTDAPAFPRNAALGCITDDALVEAYGREVGRELRELGVHVNFAPVADANTNPLNPVINTRSFGENPRRVAAKVVAYSRGLESEGVLSVAKHFPGHGDTDMDSHKALPVLRHDRARLDSVELLPFRQYIRAGLGGMMMGHLQVPAVEGDSLLPSSLSSAVVSGLLQDEMGFQGLIFTDALDMKGVTDVPGYFAKAVRAGNDMLLVQYDPAKALHEVMHAIRQGTLSEADVDARCRRVLAWKYRLGLRRKPEKISLKDVRERICTPRAEEVASALRRASVTVLDNYFDVIPLSPAPDGRGIALLSMGAQEADSAFVSAMQGQGGVDCFRLPWAASAEEQLAMKKTLAAYGRVVVSIAGVNYVGGDDVAFLESLDLRAPLVYAFFTSYRLLPLMTPALAKANAVVLAHAAEADVQRHVARVLFAEAGADGRLSMSAGRLFPAGDGVDICQDTPPAQALPDDYGMKSYVLQDIDRIARRGLEAGAYPGCRILDRDYDDGRLEVKISHQDREKILIFDYDQRWERTVWELRREQLPKAVVRALAGIGFAFRYLDDNGNMAVDTPLGRFYAVQVDTDRRDGIYVVSEGGRIAFRYTDDGWNDGRLRGDDWEREWKGEWDEEEWNERERDDGEDHFDEGDDEWDHHRKHKRRPHRDEDEDDGEDHFDEGDDEWDDRR